MINLENILFNVMNAIISKKSTEEVLEMILDSLCGLEEIVTSSIVILNEETNKMEPFGKKGAVPKKKTKHESLRLPMIINNKIVGEINIYLKENTELNDETKKKLSMIAFYGAVGLENNRLTTITEKYADLANIDGLTQLYNHKYFQKTISRELSLAMRFKYPICVAMIDIDRFKEYNDIYGHAAGDAVLSKIGVILKKNMRSYDIAARYGGEEIAIILPHAITRQGLNLAERIRKEIMDTPFELEDGKKTEITVSIGLASYPANSTSKKDLMKKADQALYLAKEEGRNRTCCSLATRDMLIKVGFCPPAFTSPYYMDVMKGITEVIEDFGSIRLIDRAPENESDYARLVEILEGFIEEKVDTIVFCSMAEKYLLPVIEKANKANINILAFNMPKPIEKAEILSYIGYDNYEAGKKAGEYVARLLRGRGKIIIIEGLPKEISSMDRKNGMVDAIKKYPNLEILAIQSGNWDVSLAKKLARNLLLKHKDIDAICVAGDDMALGISEVVSSLNKRKDLFITGIDGTKVAFEAIKKGALTATVNTNPIGMGKMLMRTVLRAMIKEEKVDKFIWLPTMIVDLQNVDQYNK